MAEGPLPLLKSEQTTRRGVASMPMGPWSKMRLTSYGRQTGPVLPSAHEVPDSRLVSIGGRGLLAEPVGGRAKSFDESVSLTLVGGARPFKAPAVHEPVIPPETTLVVSVVSADIFGKSLDAAHIHRPKLVRGLSGAPLELALASARESRLVLEVPTR